MRFANDAQFDGGFNPWYAADFPVDSEPDGVVGAGWSRGAGPFSLLRVITVIRYSMGAVVLEARIVVLPVSSRRSAP